ncbi:MAG: TlpA family protein disulfide reductase [Actinomycetota bacterium]
MSSPTAPKQTGAGLPGSAKRRIPFVAIVGAVVVVAGVLAIILSRGSDDPAPAGTEQTRPVVVTGSPLPEYEADATPDPAVGKEIPGLAGENFAGDPVRIAPNGKAKVVIFVAHWCPHCQREVPILAPDLRDEPLPAGVEAFAVSTAVDPAAPNYPPSEWLAGVDWPTPILADDAQRKASTAYGLSAFPYFVFVNADGTVSSRVTGEIPVSEFRSRIADLER